VFITHRIGICNYEYKTLTDPIQLCHGKGHDLYPEFSGNRPIGAKIFFPVFEAGSRRNTELTSMISKE
jgi:hypothetical protein